MAGVRDVLRGQLHVGAIQTLGVSICLVLVVSVKHILGSLSVRPMSAGDLVRQAGRPTHIAFVDGPIDQSRLTKTNLGHDALVLAMRHDDPLAEPRDHPAQRRVPTAARLPRVPG